MTVTFKPGDTVNVGRPLDPSTFYANLGTVIRLVRKPWGEGADVARSTDGEPYNGWGTTWCPLDSLHLVDDDTYRAWAAARRAAEAGARRGYRPAPTSLEQRAVERAPLVSAMHDVLLDRWRANGIVEDGPDGQLGLFAA